MRYRYLSDSHTHSRYSFDGEESIRNMCSSAESRGLYSLTITDHCECHEYFENNIRDDILLSAAEIKKAGEEFQGRVQILSGIELGQPTQDKKAAEDALSVSDYDFVLGSLHNLRGEQDFYFLEYNRENVPVLLDRYFEELLELAKSNIFDSLAHMDYPLRYMVGEAGIDVDIMAYMPQTDAVLETLVKNGKALEINTSGLRQRIGRTLPDAVILRRFRELGGRYVTLGSDAHRCCDIGAGIADGMELLSECGFSEFTVYRERTPQLLPIR